jgi:multimeric flavodoxin WrbA
MGSMTVPSSIQAFIDRLADDAPKRYDDLRAVIFNGTLKRSPEPSHTDGLLGIVRSTLEGVGTRVDEVRVVDHEIPAGVWPDMSEHGYQRDDFPAIYRKLVLPADIVILAGPIWLGDQSSQTRKIVERLYGMTIPPQSDAYWVGEAGPGPSYLDADGGGEDNAWTTRNTVFMSWNLLHLARMLKDSGGIPAHGNAATDWDLADPAHPNPEYRR